jgi:hypothetical protein
MKSGNRILIILTGLFLWTYYSYKFQSNADADYFDKLDLRLTGKVISIDKGNEYNGFDVIGVKIMHSNKAYAELYQAATECSIGDIVEVDSKKEIFTIRKPEGNILKDMLINDDKNYYEYLKKNHQRL